ncbi:MAG: hypothetical protein OSB21_08200 [Myxococcota bacterium]|nr:hypothetical protein [Myxococcota bacterium]
MHIRFAFIPFLLFGCFDDGQSDTRADAGLSDAGAITPDASADSDAGSDAGAGDAGPSEPPLSAGERFVLRVVEAQCPTLVRCQSRLEQSNGEGFLTSAQCAVEGRLSLSSLSMAINEQTVRVNEEELASCLNWISTVACPAWSNGSSACRAILEGTLSEGDSCITELECLGPSDRINCVDRGEDACGTCELGPVRAALGESCQDRQCARDLSCEEGLCVTEPEPQPLNAGDACESWERVCDGHADLACIGEVCVEVTYTAANGQACGGNGVFCRDEASVCARSRRSNDSIGLCVARASVGASCAVLVPGSDQPEAGPCVGGSFCHPDTAICMQPLPEGSSCRNGQYCASGRCDDNVCTAAPGVGEACTSSCMRGYLCSEGSCVDLYEVPYPLCQ